MTVIVSQDPDVCGGVEPHRIEAKALVKGDRLGSVGAKAHLMERFASSFEQMAHESPCNSPSPERVQNVKMSEPSTTRRGLERLLVQPCNPDQLLSDERAYEPLAGSLEAVCAFCPIMKEPLQKPEALLCCLLAQSGQAHRVW